MTEPAQTTLLTERPCPNDGANMVRVEGGELSLLTRPPYSARVDYPEVGGLERGKPDITVSPGHYPVIAYVCPTCGLVQLYAED